MRFLIWRFTYAKLIDTTMAVCGGYWMAQGNYFIAAILIGAALAMWPSEVTCEGRSDG